jgi:hypothetical protein
MSLYNCGKKKETTNDIKKKGKANIRVDVIEGAIIV